jgi:hypothetical protein
MKIKGKIERITPITSGPGDETVSASIRVLVYDGPKNVLGRYLDLVVSTSELAQALPMGFYRKLQEELEELMPRPEKLAPSHFPS